VTDGILVIPLLLADSADDDATLVMPGRGLGRLDAFDVR
jgi:hypothetical protein